ncbi:hypothetical protein J6590_011152, partial [Homalodisca vitripennis]
MYGKVQDCVLRYEALGALSGRGEESGMENRAATLANDFSSVTKCNVLAKNHSSLLLFNNLS